MTRIEISKLSDADLVKILKNGAASDADLGYRELFLNRGFKEIVEQHVKRKKNQAVEVNEVATYALKRFRKAVEQGPYVEMGKLQGFFANIVSYAWSDVYRKLKKYDRVHESLSKVNSSIPPEANDWMDQEELDEQKSLMRRLIKGLDEKCQRLLRMKNYGWTDAEIVATLKYRDTTVATIKTERQRCKNKLIRKFQQTQRK